MENGFEVRKRSICKALRQKGADHAVIGDPASVFYLTGISIVPYERYYGLSIDVKQEVYRMVIPRLDAGCMKGEVEEETYEDCDGPAQCIQKTLAGTKVLAVETSYFNMRTGSIFSKVAEAIVDIGDALSYLRLKKSPEEIEQIQIAADITDEALQYIKKHIKPGMSEKEVNMMLFAHMAESPGFITDEKIILVQGGANSANPHGVSGDYILQKNDEVLIDFCAYYRGYWSDITRCMVLGDEWSPKLKEIYEIVKQANLAAVAKVRPGIAAREVDETARRVITDAGYGPYFLHRTGHGLGLSVHEEPFITGENELILEAGMVFTIEPGIYLEGIGGIRLEDDILVTEDGCRVLTHSSRDRNDYLVGGDI